MGVIVPGVPSGDRGNWEFRADKGWAVKRARPSKKM